MSIKIMSEVWEHAPVKGASLLFLLALADQASDEDRCAWPGGRVLMDRVRCSERSIYNHAEELQEAGIITALEGSDRPDRYSRKGGRETTCWRINPVSEWRGAEVAPMQPVAPQGCSPLHPRGATACSRTTTTHQETKETPVALRATPSGQGPKPPRTGRRLRAVAEDSDEGLARTGSMPDDGTSDVAPPEGSPGPKRVLTAAYLGIVWDERAAQARLPKQERGATGGLVRNIKTWTAAGATPEQVLEAMDLFFLAPEQHHRAGRRAWLSFVDHWPALYAKVTAPDITSIDYYTEHAPQEKQWSSFEEYEAYMLDQARSNG